MDLDFSEEQHMLREMVRGLCIEYASPDVVRAMEDDPTGYPAELWKQLGELDSQQAHRQEERGVAKQYSPVDVRSLNDGSRGIRYQLHRPVEWDGDQGIEEEEHHR